MNPGMYNYSILKKHIAQTIEKAKGVVDDKYIAPVKRGFEKLEEVINMMQAQMKEGKYMALVLNATPLQQAFFPLVLSWLHLWSLTITIPKTKAIFGDAKGEDRQKIISENNEAAYYSGRVLSSQFFIGSEYPKYFGKIECIMGNESAAIKAVPDNFTGALKE
jgi:hypothetical protein